LARFSWESARGEFLACYKHVLGVPMSDDENRAFENAMR
jgi:hypothetical protein